ncbi:MAG TPA: PH domain-containing protein [Vicinamibacterales bacterium]
MDVPLPWERVLWRARPMSIVRRANGERYILTDLRLLILTRDRVQELALGDIAEVAQSTSPVERLLGVATLTIRSRRSASAPAALRRDERFTLASIRRATHLAALLDLLSGDPRATADADALRRALEWTPRAPAVDLRGAITAIVALPVMIAAVAAIVSLPGHAAPMASADDPIVPNGDRRSRAEIVSFMQREVMPWARQAFGAANFPGGGPDRVTCETCHGARAEAQQWTMPAVPALPRVDLRTRGWEVYNRAAGRLDAQMRNAIYGYVADAEKQSRAAYMREVIVPGMAKILHRPAYDFSKPYEYNRSRHALGCYHCHRVS